MSRQSSASRTSRDASPAIGRGTALSEHGVGLGSHASLSRSPLMAYLRQKDVPPPSDALRTAQKEHARSRGRASSLSAQRPPLSGSMVQSATFSLSGPVGTRRHVGNSQRGSHASKGASESRISASLDSWRDDVHIRSPAESSLRRSGSSRDSVLSRSSSGAHASGMKPMWNAQHSGRMAFQQVLCALEELRAVRLGHWLRKSTFVIFE